MSKAVPSWTELLTAESREVESRETERREAESPKVDLRKSESRKVEKGGLKRRKVETREADLRNNVKMKTGKQKHVKPGSRQVVLRQTGRRKTVTFDGLDGNVTVGAKASEHLAVFWATEAKRKRLPMSYVILHALIEAFGLPEGTTLVEE